MASTASGGTRAKRPSRRTMKTLLQPVGLDAAETVELPAQLGLKEAGELRQQLLSLRGRMVDLEGSKVERLGGVAFQVLLSARATWRQDGQRFRLVGTSDAMGRALAILGAPAFNTHDAFAGAIR